MHSQKCKNLTPSLKSAPTNPTPQQKRSYAPGAIHPAPRSGEPRGAQSLSLQVYVIIELTTHRTQLPPCSPSRRACLCACIKLGDLSLRAFRRIAPIGASNRRRVVLFRIDDLVPTRLFYPALLSAGWGYHGWPAGWRASRYTCRINDLDKFRTNFGR